MRGSGNALYVEDYSSKSFNLRELEMETEIKLTQEKNTEVSAFKTIFIFQRSCSHASTQLRLISGMD